MSTGYPYGNTAITDTLDRFARDTRDHQMTVLHDNGLYRHLRFARPTTGIGHYDLITWPHHLAINGDGDGHTFARTDDMFAFFRNTRREINPGYWAEKVVSGRDSLKTYSEDRLREKVINYLDDALDGYDTHTVEAIRSEVQDQVFDSYDSAYEEGARIALRDFRYKTDDIDFQFVDTEEWDLCDWGFWFLLRCHQVVWGVAWYDEWVAAGRPAGAWIPKVRPEPDQQKTED